MFVTLIVCCLHNYSPLRLSATYKLISRIVLNYKCKCKFVLIDQRILSNVCQMTNEKILSERKYMVCSYLLSHVVIQRKSHRLRCPLGELVPGWIIDTCVERSKVLVLVFAGNRFAVSMCKGRQLAFSSFRIWDK